ncbi:hypothetical protein [Patulibacter americanus]|uniref:hypothetical protein n=1 Tax=Patulibacter americanus TaxID=588672 RepID=UPI0003B76093|nr:hypothetical protein [Patulibacter americanus]
MRVGPLRRGELLVFLGLLGLLATLFLDWFQSGTFGDRETMDGGPDGVSAFRVTVQAGRGWDPLGHPWLELVALFVLALVAVLGTAVRARPGRPTYGALVALVLAIPLGALVLLTTLLRGLVFRPGFTLGDTTLRFDPAVGTYVGLASILVALVGLWVALGDDRTAAPESAYEPPPARPVPPLRPDEPGTTPPVE